MSNYTKTTDFDVKDSLPSGDTGKIIRGSEFEVEFENIEVAIASKADATNPTFSGTANFTNVNITGNTTLGNAATDTVTISGDVAVDTNTLFVDVSENKVGIGTITPATALDVTGTTTTDGLTVNTAQGNVTVPSTSSSLDFARAGSSYIRATDAAGNFRFITGADDFTSTRLFLANNGDVSFFEDTGVTAKFFWDASAERLGIGTTAPAANLHVSDATEAQIYLSDTGGAGATSANSQLVFTHGAGNTNNAYIGNDQSVVTGAFSMGTLVNYPMSFVINSSEVMRIETSGNVGIGTSSPSAKLEVEGANAAGDISIKVQNTDATANSRAVISYETQNGTWTLGSNRSGGFVLDTPASGEALRVTNDKNVGIGTSSPAADLEVSSDANTKVRISDSTNVNQRFEISHNAGFTALTAGNNAAKGVLAFYQYDGTDTTEAMRLDASGNLNTSFDLTIGIGSTSSLFIKKAFDTTAALKFQRTTAGTPVDASVSCDANENLVFDWNLDGLNATCLFKSNSDEKMRIDASGRLGIGGRVPSANLVEIGRAGFASEFVQIFSTTAKAAIGAAASSTAIYSQLTNNAAAPLDFIIGSTAAARIDSSRNLLIGTNTAGGQSGLSILPNNSQGSAVCVFDRPDTANQSTAVAFRNNGTSVGTIVYSNTATIYNTSSDVRLKENITDAPEGNVDALQVRSFDWKADGSHQEYGFIAQELEVVAPYAVTKGETEDDMWGVDYSKLVPMLVKEIQDLKARIATLEAN